tara:strand:+ start:488 stop:1360 length:873 start_codon:yes stop_codon:yes gene_type:complete
MTQPTAKVIHITATENSSLFQLLSTHIKNQKIESIISSGGVWRNQERLSNPYQTIKAKETVKVYISPTQGYRYAFSDELIIEETNDWVIVYKEPLITVAMDRSNQFFNLMAGLNDYYGFKDIRNGVQPITRLDYRVAGLMLFSKTKQAERYLFKQMQQRRIKKRYQIIVNGTDYANWYRISNKLSATHKAMTSNTGKIAKTAFVKRSEYENKSIFDVSTQTGRRHQIRCHSADKIAPIINDELYGYRSKNRHSPIGLIATDLAFHWHQKYIKISVSQKWRNYWLRGLCLK